jgi:hypothetical protein
MAGIYDYHLGGSANTAAERRIGDRMLSAFPHIRPVAQANRIFLHRAVRHLIRLGIRQFIDIGSGMPTMGSTHTVADGLVPDATRVVYVDNEPGTVRRAQSLIHHGGDPVRLAVIEADLRKPDALWRQAIGTGLIDKAEPIGLLIIAVLHVRQPDGRGIDVAPQAVARYRELLGVDSYLAISHATNDGVPATIKAGLSDVSRMYDADVTPVLARSRADITGLFGDFDILPPGVVWTPLWHPEETVPGAPAVMFDSPAESAVLAGVAHKRR